MITPLRIATLSGLAACATLMVNAQAEVTITEFLAINTHGPVDKDDNLSAWIEFYNDGPEIVDLDGWYLTNDADELTKYEMPRLRVPANSYGLIFASGKDFNSLFNTEVHANFSLGATSNYVALVMPDGVTIASRFEDVPKQRPGISYGLTATGEPSYFRTPTPLADNASPLAGFVSDTKFSVDRGFYDAPFEVEITTETPGARILYTTSGRAPSEGNLFTGPIEHVYEGPITIDKTTVLRAAAFMDGLGPSNVDTQTYVFAEDVIEQDTMRTQITESDEYGPQMLDALTALPSISLAVEDADFVGGGTSGTNDVESPTSVEWLNPNGSKGFQVEAGISRFGGYFTNFAKKSLRLYFRKRYGDAKLNYPVYRGHETGLAPVEEFDSLSLRSGSHDMQQRGAYMSNRFVDDSMLEMGGFAPHGRFVHVYLNGVYWGQYHLRERWSAPMGASYFGGDRDEYDAINGNDNFTSDFKAYDGTLDYWRETENLSREEPTWAAMQGRIDTDDYFDFMLLWSNGDSESEFQAIGSRSQGVPFKFFLKDADGFLRTPPGGKISHAGPGRYMSSLRSEGDPDYQIAIADRIHKHYFNDGALTDERNIARLQRRVDEVYVAFIAEAARWNFRTPTSWRSYQENLIERHFPGLAETMVKRFKARGLYPTDAIAPSFNQHGGVIEPGFVVMMSAGTLFNPQGGDFLYTLDGSDPRLAGGAVSPTAMTYDRAGDGFALNETVTIKTRSYHNEIWSPLTEATFHIGDRPKEGDLVISEIHYRPAAPSETESAAGHTDSNLFEFVEVYNRSDRSLDLSELNFTDGIRFQFAKPGIITLNPGAFAVVVANQAAFEMRYGSDLPIAGEYTGFKLNNGGEPLRLSLTDGTVIQELRYNDKDPWPEEPDGAGPSLTVKQVVDLVDANDASQWQASAEMGGSPGSLGGGGVTPPVEDRDHDGLAGFLEAALGTSDDDPASGPNAFSFRQQSDRWVFEAARDSSVTNVTLSLEVSSDLRTWTAGSTLFDLDTSDPTRTQWRSQQAVGDLTSQQWFVRIQATQR